MDTVFLCVGTTIVIGLLHAAIKYVESSESVSWVRFAIIVGALVVATIPFILIKEGVLAETAINIGVAGIVAVYSALMVGRLSRNNTVG